MGNGAGEGRGVGGENGKRQDLERRDAALENSRRNGLELLDAE